MRTSEPEACEFCGTSSDLSKRYQFNKRKLEKLLAQNHALRDEIRSQRFDRRAIESLQSEILELDEDLRSARDTIKSQRREITILQRRLNPRTIPK